MTVKDKEIIEVLNSIFSKSTKDFNIEFWNGETISYSSSPKFIIKFLDKDVFMQLITNPNVMAFAQAFIDKKIDIEGDIFEAIKLKDDIKNIEISNKDKISLFFKTAHNMHTKEKDKQNISYHYDISNKFYNLFLGNTMMYSCAYFKKDNWDLNTAQQNKMEHICKKLQLKQGDKLLDVGCGWGSMIIYAVKNYNVIATGITISEEQYKYAKQRIKEENLEDKCFVELKDYRDIEGKELYDKIVSIGMFEHVGVKNLPTYFEHMRRLLKNNGIFLNHGITVKKDTKLSKHEGEFIEKYIFPGGELKNIGYIIDIMEDIKFDIVDVECLRQHYYKTLRCWTTNLEANKQEAIRLTNEGIYRTWLLYMIGCAINFEQDCISVYQVLLTKQKKKSNFIIPLTREYMYI